MTETEDDIIIEPGDGELIATTAVRTLYVLVVAAALLCVLLRLLLPLPAMRFYANVGNVARAYECADDAVRSLDGEDKIDAHVNAIAYSVKLMNERPDVYAPEVERQTGAYLNEDTFGPYGVRSARIDNYNLANSAKALHPNLASYDRYLHEQHTRARAFQGKTDKILFEGRYVSVQDAISYARSPIDMSYVAAMLAEIIAVDPDYALDFSVVTIRNTITEELDVAFENVPLAALERLKCYEKLVTRLIVAGRLNENDPETLIMYGNETYGYDELYYDVLLPNYCK